MFILLSYPLDKKTPLYGDTPSVQIKPVKQISKGDTANTSWLSFSSHSSTHIDVPFHFFENGARVTDLPFDTWIYDRPVVVDCPRKPDELIQKEDLIPYQEQLVECDLLLLRTGFTQFRYQDLYVSHNPGLSESLAQMIVDHFPRIRAIGLDTISVSPFRQRDIGRKVHRILLDPNSPPRILIEDLNLSLVHKELKRVFVIPLMIQGGDGAPATVFAEVD